MNKLLSERGKWAVSLMIAALISTAVWYSGVQINENKAMETITKKESAVLKPSIRQMFKSVTPYFSSSSKIDLKGDIDLITMEGGQTYFIYLPEGYSNSEKKYPVLYHLHGAGVFQGWAKLDIHWVAEQQEKAVRENISQPMIIVAPYDKSKFSMWADGWKRKNNMATAVVSEVRDHVETNYKALKNRESRFIQGFSMGGFGAAMLGFKHQELFSKIIIMDGAMHNWETINKGRSAIVRDQFGNDEEYFNEWSPWKWAERAEISKTPVFIIEGLMVDYNTRYYNYLKDLGADVRKVSPDCYHDVRCLQATYGQEALRFLGE